MKWKWKFLPIVVRHHGQTALKDFERNQPSDYRGDKKNSNQYQNTAIVGDPTDCTDAYTGQISGSTVSLETAQEAAAWLRAQISCRSRVQAELNLRNLPDIFPTRAQAIKSSTSTRSPQTPQTYRMEPAHGSTDRGGGLDIAGSESKI